MNDVNKEPPWVQFYGNVPATLEYPQITLYEAVMHTVARLPDAVAFDFLGYTATYRELGAAIDRGANALASIGVKRGDGITISMPTSPQGVICFYAANKLGAVSSMIHPLSTRDELELYLKASGSRFALTLDAFYEKFAHLRPATALEVVILARIPEYLPPLARLGFWLTKGRKVPRVPPDPGVRWWGDLMRASHPQAPRAPTGTHDPAVIMYSAGTTGTPKGILLSSQNLISEGTQVATWGGMGQGDAMLAVLPLFHGAGLGVCINASLMVGCKCIMLPTFDAKEVARAIRKKRPNLMVGVPTLYDALVRDPSLAHTDLSCLRATFSGADTLPRPVKERFERFVAASGGSVKLLEGYGLTEAVSAIMAMPLGTHREGSIGIPFPDVFVTITVPGTPNEVAVGEEGEICVSGPPVMLGYMSAPEETAAALQTHADGRTWLHTGDLGRMDADGFCYFTCRLKRLIKSSGFNVYPAQVEAVLYQHAAVEEACVVGVHDERQIERVKAFVVLKDRTQIGADMEKRLIEHCRAHLIKWSCPREVEFRDRLPRTRIGKIDFKLLVAEHAARMRPQG